MKSVAIAALCHAASSSSPSILGACSALIASIDLGWGRATKYSSKRGIKISFFSSFSV
jgi:hypothetical protein